MKMRVSVLDLNWQPYERQQIGSRRTFAFGLAKLNGHVIRGQWRAEDERAGGARETILETARVSKGRERCRARRQLHVPRLREADKRERGNCGHEGPREGHCHGK